MDFFSKTGKMALGSRLRRLSEQVTEDAAKIYGVYGVELQPRWFPVFFLLSQQGDMPITMIANEIGQSHVSVGQIVREMVKKGMVIEKSDRRDGRKTLVSLSKKGKEQAVKIAKQYIDVTGTIESMLATTTHDLWKALAEWEHLLDQKSLLKRVEEQRKLRESGEVKLIPFSKKYQQAFRDLNEEWISRYFRMEEADYKALDNPQSYILKKGGYIVIALYNHQPVGTCALLKMEDGVFELAKMAVSPMAQGKGVGYLLGKHVIEKARELGARKIYLESNTILKPAISLYYKLGFEKVTGRPTPYDRCNIQMELSLDN
jgi:GNAT superfamily N-acetyltransferase/predicted transcriptional regulator